MNSCCWLELFEIEAIKEGCSWDFINLSCGNFHNLYIPQDDGFSLCF